MCVNQAPMRPAKLVVFQFITPPAEKAVEDLPAQDRAKVIKTLSQPVRLDRCKKMAKVRSTPLWRARVTDNLRITFCWIANQVCVVHVGAHAVSDHYVAHVDNGPPSHFKSLKESFIMKKNTNGTLVQESIPPASGAGTNAWHEWMERGIRGLVENVVVDDMNTLQKLNEEQLQLVGNETRRLAEDNVVTKARIDELATALEQGRSSQRTELVEMAAALRQEIQREKADVNNTVASATQELERRLANAGAENQAMAARLEKMDAELAKVLGTLASLTEQHAATVNALNEMKRAASERGTQATNQGWKSRITRLAQAVQTYFRKAKPTPQSIPAA